MDELIRLGIALGIGLLVGTERGWEARDREDGQRAAGIRTFALIGLLGGLAGIPGEPVTAWLIPVTFVAVAALIAISYVAQVRSAHKVGMTTEIAALAVFALGALAGIGEKQAAAAAGVIVVAILGAKPVLHAWLQKLERVEIDAAVRLLLISVVLLPVLPDRDMGPFAALNPFRIWLMVVLIATVSFVGYVAVRIAGTQKGLYVTGLFGGLASSTAVTLTFSRLARDKTASLDALAAGTLAACSTMFPRMLLLAAPISPSLAKLLAAPLLVAGIVGYAASWLLARRGSDDSDSTEPGVSNPLDLKMAIRFGALLVAILFAARALKTWAGDAAVLVLAAVSGLADVDAITLSVASMTREGLAAAIAVAGVSIAAATNTFAKIGLAFGIGGAAFGARIGAALLVSLAIGGAVAWIVASRVTA
jgi:uncharacterized membrane protein (DUF4010 family)